VIFGAGEFAEVANFYFDHDSDYTPVAFTVDRSFMREDSFCRLPVIPFEDLAGTYPPGSADLFVAIGYSGLNCHRAREGRGHQGARLHARLLPELTRSGLAGL